MMISSGIRNFILLLSILLLLNIVCAVSNVPNNNRRPYPLNNQRSADTGYKYAWFTRDIHDYMNNDEDNNSQERQFPPQKMFRMKSIKNVFDRKYDNNDENLSE